MVQPFRVFVANQNALKLLSTGLVYILIVIIELFLIRMNATAASYTAKMSSSVKVKNKESILLIDPFHKCLRIPSFSSQSERVKKLSTGLVHINSNN